MLDVRCRKVYVSVNIDIDNEGDIHPRLIRCSNGLVYLIDRILCKFRASSARVGGGAIWYTILIGGKETYLFHEDEKWFIEAKVRG